MENLGKRVYSCPCKKGIDLNIKKAWELTHGSDSIVVAFVDTGLSMDNAVSKEFQNRLINGYSFVSKNGNYNDIFGHGTNLISIAMADGSNSYMIAGVNWNSKVIPIQAFITNNPIDFIQSNIASAIIYAADNGARIINLSLSASGLDIEKAVNYALEKGCIIIASSGNANSESIYYPAKYPGVIAIGAINCSGARANPFTGLSSGFGSNYGKELDFVAPGDEILGLSILGNDNVQSGTSQAAALASGVVSLMLSVNNRLTANQVYDILKSTARDLIGPANEDSLGWDKYYGWGLIDAGAAVKMAYDMRTDVASNTPEMSSLRISGSNLNVDNPVGGCVFVYNYLGELLTSRYDYDLNILPIDLKLYINTRLFIVYVANNSILQKINFIFQT